jgi:hypothetical protein
MRIAFLGVFCEPEFPILPFAGSLRALAYTYDCSQFSATLLSSAIPQLSHCRGALNSEEGAGYLAAHPGPPAQGLPVPGYRTTDGARRAP